MKKLVVTENITLDGVIEATGDWFSVAGGDDTSDINATLRRQMEAEDALLLGRNTFKSFRGYWPAQTDDTTGVTAHLNQVSKYVMSGTLDDPAVGKHYSAARRPDRGGAGVEEPVGRGDRRHRQHHARA